jgi:hypothetical protein
MRAILTDFPDYNVTNQFCRGHRLSGVRRQDAIALRGYRFIDTKRVIRQAPKEDSPDLTFLGYFIYSTPHGTKARH